MSISLSLKWFPRHPKDVTVNTTHLASTMYSFHSLSTEDHKLNTQCDGLCLIDKEAMAYPELWSAWSQVVTFRYLDDRGRSQCFDACTTCNSSFLSTECSQTVQSERSERFKAEFDHTLLAYWHSSSSSTFWETVRRVRENYP